MSHGDQFEVGADAPIAQPIGMAIASLVLGILALVLSFLVIGLVAGIFGIVFGAIHLSGARAGRAMAGWGLGLSVAGALASLSFAGLYAFFVVQFMPMMDFEDFTETAAFSEWEGVRAHDFSVTDLEGTEVALGKLRGKRVVVDVWASWNTPSVDKVAHLIELAEAASAEELVVIGVSDEPEETVRSFALDNGVNYIMASFDELPEPFGDVIDVPVTFIIDREGVIQQVLAGYQDYEALHDAAMAPDFAGTPLEKPVVPLEDLIAPAQAFEANVAWTRELTGAQGLCAGDWNGDGAIDILVATGEPELHVLDGTGETTEKLSLPEEIEAIKLGTYHGKPRLLGYANWGQAIQVVDRSGNVNWDYSTWMGVNGAHWIDTDGDGTDEMIVGMNGAGGLHLVSAEGKRLWRVKLGNVWNQSAVRTAGGIVRIVATDAGGQVRIFDGEGEKVGVLNAIDDYYTEVASALVDGAESIQILAGGGERVVALDEKGRLHWSTPAEEDHGAWRSTRFASGDADADGRSDWAFHGPDGVLLVVSSAGEKLAELPNMEDVTDFAFAGSQLVVIEDDTLTAYAFAPATQAIEGQPTPEAPVDPGADSPAATPQTVQ